MPVDLRVVSPAAVATMKQSLVHEREKFSQEANFAYELIRAWGMLGYDAGETSRGHQKVLPIEPNDLVDRAVLTTRLAFDTFREQGWIIDLPPADELLGEEARQAGFIHQLTEVNIDDDEIPF